MNGGESFVVMGVAGSGKSTVAAALAARLGCPFVDADSLHPAENIEKMRGGVALTEADRAPWFVAIARVLAGWRAAGTPGVIACSALRRAHRDALRVGAADVRFVYLRAGRDLIAARLTQRRGHFMPASLSDSQFEILEEPGEDERAISIDAALAPRVIVENIVSLSGG
jgi:gluconokinase